jgi:hypothetical protein
VTGLLVGIETAKEAFNQPHILRRYVGTDDEAKRRKLWSRVFAVKSPNIVSKSGLMVMGGTGVLIVNTADDHWRQYSSWSSGDFNDCLPTLNFLFSEINAVGPCALDIVRKYRTLPSRSLGLFSRPNRFIADGITQFLLLLVGNHGKIRLAGQNHFDVDRNVGRGGMANIFDYRMKAEMCRTVDREGKSGIADTEALKSEPRSVNHFQLLARGLSSSLRRFGGFSGFPRLPSIDTKDADGDDDSRLFPSWCVFLAPVGVISLLWGWDCIRNETNLLWGGIAFGVGGIVWGYGLLVFLIVLGQVVCVMTIKQHSTEKGQRPPRISRRGCGIFFGFQILPQKRRSRRINLLLPGRKRNLPTRARKARISAFFPPPRSLRGAASRAVKTPVVDQYETDVPSAAEAAIDFSGSCGAAEAAPFQDRLKLSHCRDSPLLAKDARNGAPSTQVFGAT